MVSVNTSKIPETYLALPASWYLHMHVQWIRYQDRLHWKRYHGNTLFYTEEHASDNTAGYSGGLESSLKNRNKYGRNILDVQKNYSKSKKNVKQCHKRNKLFCYLADTLDSTKKDHGDQDGDHNTDDQIGCGNCAFANNVII